MISVFKDMVAEPEARHFAVFTISINDTRFKLGTFSTLPEAHRFMAKRTKDCFYCPEHNWLVGNPHDPFVCPGLSALSDRPWEATPHTVDHD